MASPRDHLPPALSDDSIRELLSSIGLPKPTGIEPLRVAGVFHRIYLVHFDGGCAAALLPARRRNDDGSMSLVLRVAGGHLPRTKTLNEVAVMAWVRAHTRIPVPAVVRFDASPDNALGHEFMLVERAAGRCVHEVYAELGEAPKQRLVEQLTDVLVELARHSWSHVGGLRLDTAGGFVPGPVLDESFWTAPDVAAYWGPGESVETLNPTGPYADHAGLVDAYLACCAHAIDVHASLALLRDTVPRLRALAACLPSLRALADTRLVLAHKDLHFANIMATPDGHLTAVLDWEFAGVVPACRWDPVRAFLWNGGDDSEAIREQDSLWRLFERALQARGVAKWWEEAGEDSTLDDIWTVVSHARALVEACPRGQKADKVASWREAMEAALTRLGV